MPPGQTFTAESYKSICTPTPTSITIDPGSYTVYAGAYRVNLIIGRGMSQTSQTPDSGVVASTTQSRPAALSGTDRSAEHSTGLSTNAKIAIGVVVPLTVIAAVIAFFLRLHRRRTAKLPRNTDNNFPEGGHGDKPELEGSRGMARVTQKPELEANGGEARNIPPADTTTTKPPTIPPDQNTRVCLGQQHLDNTERRTPGSDAAADNTMPAHELEATRSPDPQSQMIEHNPQLTETVEI